MPGSHPRPFGMESRYFIFFFWLLCVCFVCVCVCVCSSTPRKEPDLSSPTGDGTRAPAGVLTTGPPERVLIEFFKLSPVVLLHKEGWEHRAGADSLGNAASSNNNHHLHRCFFLRCFFLRCFMGDGQVTLLHQVGFPAHFWVLLQHKLYTIHKVGSVSVLKATCWPSAARPEWGLVRTLAQGGSGGVAGENALMASVLYGRLPFPPRASFLASLEKSAIHLSCMQASIPNLP